MLVFQSLPPVWSPGKECATPWLPRVVRGDHGRLSSINCLSSVQGDISFSPPGFVFYPLFLSCAIVPSTSPFTVLYFFLFPSGVWDRIDPPFCACRKKQLKQGVAHELPLSGTWATSLSLYLALPSILSSFHALSSRLLLLLLSSSSFSSHVESGINHFLSTLLCLLSHSLSCAIVLLLLLFTVSYFYPP
ncbi:hypothetical protein PoB_005223700 [Plakobranchus ocellatus]|uniref:Uncharacterized protein n=1 Tax=Plakobranchus ocellatus TaxID=259542 RepID=A0AAV4C2Y2_9GAST|nr:hypothetical protein PoB_005223700 [Plakobranchus ocellatus]